VRPDLPVERYLRDAFHIFPPARTSDIQRIRLAETALGSTEVSGQSGSWQPRLPSCGFAGTSHARGPVTRGFPVQREAPPLPLCVRSETAAGRVEPILADLCGFQTDRPNKANCVLQSR
jgi:hypothetical protein